MAVKEPLSSRLFRCDERSPNHEGQNGNRASRYWLESLGAKMVDNSKLILEGVKYLQVTEVGLLRIGLDREILLSLTDC
jgi:hypothetical protein